MPEHITTVQHFSHLSPNKVLIFVPQDLHNNRDSPQQNLRIRIGHKAQNYFQNEYLASWLLSDASAPLLFATTFPRALR